MAAGEEISVPRLDLEKTVRITGRALPYDEGDCRDIRRQTQTVERLLFQLWRPLAFSFPGKNYHADSKQPDAKEKEKGTLLF